MSSFISKLINLAGNITGVLPVVNGGTGVTTSTGSGNTVLSTSPTLVTPVLGTPTSGNLSNCTSYPNVTQSVAGLVASAGQLLGTNTNDSASAGRVGELIASGSIGTGVTVSNSAFTALGSITLTAGQWLILANATYNGLASNTYFIACINTTSGSNSGNTYGLDQGIGPVIATSGVGSVITLFISVKITTNTTYYINCETSATSAGSGGILGNILGIRPR